MQTPKTLYEVLPKLKPSLREKLTYSVNLLRKAEKLAFRYDTNGFVLAFSGGKDSQALFHVAQLAGVKFKAQMNLTSVDPPDVIRFVRHIYPEVEMIPPDTSIFREAVRKGILPTRTIRWCCKTFKELKSPGKVTLIGIRHAESARRAKRNEVEINNRKFSGTLEELDKYRDSLKGKKYLRKDRIVMEPDGEQTISCISGKETLLISPIINWTDDDVWEFLNACNVPHCKLYDEGFKRIGCILCPMSNPRQKRIEIARYPHIKHNWLNAIRKIRIGGGIRRRLYLMEHHQGGIPVWMRTRYAKPSLIGGYPGSHTKAGMLKDANSNSHSQNDIIEPGRKAWLFFVYMLFTYLHTLSHGPSSSSNQNAYAALTICSSVST